MHNIQSLRLRYVWSRYELNFYKKKKNTIGRFVGGGNEESMTVLISAAVLVGKFLPPIRDSSHSGDSSSHIEKMRSTSRVSARERKSNQRKKRKNKWKRLRQGGPIYSEIFIQKFSVLLRNKSIFMFYSIFRGVLENLQILEWKLTLVCSPFFLTLISRVIYRLILKVLSKPNNSHPPLFSALISRVICWFILKFLNKSSNSHTRVIFSVYLDKF